MVEKSCSQSTCGTIMFKNAEIVDKDAKKMRKVITKFLKFILLLVQAVFCVCAWIVILYAAFPILPPILVFFGAKLIEQVIFQKLYDAESVTSGSALWMQDSPKNRGIINAVLVFKGKVELQKMRERLMETLVQNSNQEGENPYYKCSQYITSGILNYFWLKETNFKIEQHVTQWPNEATSKDMVEQILSKICSRPFEKGMSQWEYILIPWVENGNTKTAAMFRVHHSVADGVSLVNYLIKKMPDNNVKCIPLKKFSERNRIMLMLKGLLYSPIFLIKMMFGKADASILHGKPLSGCKSVTWSDPLDISLVKKIKVATKTTINDVVVSCLAAALREFFIKRNLSPPQDIKVSLPVDLRKDTEQDAVKFENRFAILQLALPIGISDPLAQLRELQSRMNYMKYSGEPFAVGPAMDLLISVLPVFVTRPFFKFICQKTTGVLSNVPGPQESIHVVGHELEFFTFWPPQRGDMGMSFAISSYNGKVFVGIESDTAILEEPWEICREFHGQVQCLLNRLNLN